MATDSRDDAPFLSIVVVLFNMQREGRRTLHTLSPEYQGVPRDRYEVIVVDNGSDVPFGPETVAAISSNFRYFYLQPDSPSPARALNHGARLSKGRLVGFMIDGARMLSPGVLRYAIRASRGYRHPIISTLAFHLGPKDQSESAREGYTREVEDRLLESIDWRRDGYQLFRVASLAGSSRDGWFRPLAESNCIFVTRETLEALGGFDEAFDAPGGGLVNLDFYRRACERPETDLVVLLGEASFHQYHSGSMTGIHNSFQKWRMGTKHARQYRRIRGRKFEPPSSRCDFMGHARPEVRPWIRESLRLAEKSAESSRGATRSRAILILGMHRSGTSALAGSLQQAGVELGDVVTVAPHNAKGNRECPAIMLMHEDLLERNGGSWQSPPRRVRWSPLHEATRDLLISRFQAESLWGFKDPRTLFTVDGWLDVLPHAEFVGIFRHPTLVAQSLWRRDRLPFLQAVDIWQRYNQRLLRLHRAHRFPLIEFHSDGKVFRSELRALVARLDLPGASRELTFFEQELRAGGETEAAVPAKALRLYEKLRKRSRSFF